ncbi:VWA domain-containing protein [Stieleria sp. TO1_6]|uniref:vWA domain-containing protein n=1 Tax=Stieleria tagensis TaxID=2956795 RepID=UPI00209B3FF1|nr:VWA domain-containing protein [Stieleria tagensis]MCO8123256.1 VWA domain-containing protein [Stieleria tagensis]
MSFLNPLAILIGAVGLSLPLVVHWLTKPRPTPLPLSTIWFVHEAIRQRRSRHRLRDLLVLLLRMLAIALIALAIARPMMRRDVVIDTSNSQINVARVLIVDVSQSMAAGRGGRQPLERARSIADKYISSDQDLVVGVVFAAARPEVVFQQLSSNFSALRQSIRNVATLPQSADAMAAINQAAVWLGETDDQMKRELVVISDFQRSDWGAVRFDALPSDTKIQLESVALTGPDNLAVLAVRTPDRISAGEPFQCEVELGNFSALERPIRCRLKLGQLNKTIEKTLPPGQSTVTFPVEIASTGWQSGSVELDSAADDLPADDIRPLAIEVSPAAKVILLSGQNPQARPSSSYYLTRAIQQISGDLADARMSPQKFSLDRARSADALVLDHPGRLERGLLKRLADLMRRGTGMIYFVSELADGVNLSGLQQELGAGMQMPVRFVPPARGRPRRDLAIAEISRRERPFEVFGDALDLALAPLRFGGGLATELTDQSLQDRILGSLTDQSAWLTMTDCGGGRLAIVNADLEQSNLAVQPAFLPLVGELVGSVLPAGGSGSETTCGLPMVRLLPSDISIEDDIVARPDEDWPTIASGYGSWEASGSGMVWNWAAPPERGVYEAVLDGRPRFKVAVTTPASESDLSSLQSGSLIAQGQSKDRIGFRDTGDQRENKDRWWNWLLVACVLGLVCEICTLRIFRT